MPVDRSQLPPLPGKPDWYVENAPRALDPLLHQPREAAPDPFHYAPPAAVPLQSEPTLLPTASALAANPFPTVGSQPENGKGLKRVRSLAGKLRH
jgi:hypothetical protein